MRVMKISENIFAKRILLACAFGLVFITGFLCYYVMSSVYIDVESPFLLGLASATEQPGNWISKENIEIFDDKIIIYVNNATISSYADTGSMLPTLGENSNGIKIVPENPDEISVGDIITFESGDKLIVHRVIGKGEDENGIYFITKGDNNQETDGKVYFENIKYVTIALIY